MALIAIVQKYRIVLAPETEVRELTNDGLLCHAMTTFDVSEGYVVMPMQLLTDICFLQ